MWGSPACLMEMLICSSNKTALGSSRKYSLIGSCESHSLARSWMGTFALFGTRSLTMAQHRATLAHVTSEIKCCRYIRIYGGERRQTERERDRERFLYTLYMYVYILYHSCVCSIPACAVRCLHFFYFCMPNPLPESAGPRLHNVEQWKKMGHGSEGARHVLHVKLFASQKSWICILSWCFWNLRFIWCSFARSHQ